MSETKTTPNSHFSCFVYCILMCLLGLGFGISIGLPRAPASFATHTATPTLIFVRGHQWVVVENKESTKFLTDNNLAGYTDCAQNAIFLTQKETAADERDTLLHELLHAGTCEDGKSNNLYWNSTTSEDHEGIYKISDYFSDLFYENPELAKYLAGQ